jgi:hypothetical protein
MCLYLPVDASKLPSKQRMAYVALAVRRAAPFPDPEFDVLWLQGHAAVWYWSRERAVAAANGAAVSRYRAEALYLGSIPDADAEQLLAVPAAPVAVEDEDAGFEARIWRQGRLLASRWWRTLPDDAAWELFARGAGLEATHPRPDPVFAPLRDHPLSADRRRLFDSAARMRAPLVGAIATVACLALLAWQGAGVVHAVVATSSVEGRISVLSARMEKIIAAREKADAASARIDALLALRAPASQVRLLGEVKRLTPGKWLMLAWTQPSPEVLQVTLQATDADASAIVAAWESSPLLQDVSLASSDRPGELTISAKLTPIGKQDP